MFSDRGDGEKQKGFFLVEWRRRRRKEEGVMTPEL